MKDLVNAPERLSLVEKQRECIDNRISRLTEGIPAARTIPAHIIGGINDRPG
jgi:hypothetical protein